MICILKVYTSRINYKGKDRLDISVKSGIKDVKSGIKIFAPTWEMVMGHKNGILSNENYTEQYKQMMEESYNNHKEVWQNLLKRDRIVLCCYCRVGEFCHRYILADILVKLGAEYCGEV